MSCHNIGWIFRHYARNVCILMAGGDRGGGAYMYGFFFVRCAGLSVASYDDQKDQKQSEDQKMQ